MATKYLKNMSILMVLITLLNFLLVILCKIYFNADSKAEDFLSSFIATSIFAIVLFFLLRYPKKDKKYIFFIYSLLLFIINIGAIFLADFLIKSSPYLFLDKALSTTLKFLIDYVAAFFIGLTIIIVKKDNLKAN